MRTLLLSLMVMLAWPIVSFAGPKEDALSVVEKWDKAFMASDVDGMVRLYAPDATFIGTSSKTPVVKTEGIRSYFENAFLTNFKVRHSKSTPLQYCPTARFLLRVWT
jgi:hypothetical protein